MTFYNNVNMTPIYSKDNKSNCFFNSLIHVYHLEPCDGLVYKTEFGLQKKKRVRYTLQISDNGSKSIPMMFSEYIENMSHFKNRSACTLPCTDFVSVVY
jgi:hypothetical protein